MFRFTSLPVDCENSPSWVMLMGILYYITIYSEDQQGNMFTQMYFGLISVVVAHHLGRMKLNTTNYRIVLRMFHFEVKIHAINHREPLAKV